jgi:hypothetical protein
MEAVKIDLWYWNVPKDLALSLPFFSLLVLDLVSLCFSWVSNLA